MAARSSIRLVSVQATFAGLLLASCTAESVLPTGGILEPMKLSGAPDAARFGGPAPSGANPALAATPADPALAPNATAFTSSIAAMGARGSAITPVRASLKEGLDATHSNVTRARAIREGMTPGSLDRQILTWAIALKGDGVPAHEIASAARDLEGWPGMKTLRANSERALFRERAQPAQVISAFAGTQPETPEGTMALARALIETGRESDARALVSRIWRNERMSRDAENAMRSNFGSLLTKADHKFRMDKLLYNDRLAEAERVAAAANSETLFRARSAAIKGEGASRALAAVPGNQKSDPSFLFASAQTARKANKPQEAAALLMRGPTDPALLVDTDAWWNEARIVSRMLIEAGQAREAYALAARQRPTGTVERVEKDFHAGWYALRELKDPATARKHFQVIAEASRSPISQSRAYYWLGRAAEAGGGGSASDAYQRAARYSTTFYGQLAAAKLGRAPGAVAFPSPGSAERQRFEKREAVRAIKRLEELGSQWRADALYRSLGQELTSPGELGLLAVMAERRGAHHISLDVGKAAYQNGVDAPALAFPVGAIPSGANISASGKALAYAIARQESAFNTGAKSPVGALGLLQLMPATAKSLSREIGASYSDAKLLSDVSYNALLGSRYLGQQIDTFNGSYVLTFVAYNAGPRRAREWIERFGDPRGRPIDEVVDWVEKIPFTETRNYVQRVMENYQVYKLRLGASSDIESDLRNGRQG